MGYYIDPTKIIIILYPENLKLGNCLERVMGLRFARVHVILMVILEMTNPNAIGSKIGRRNGREILVRSPKRR